MSTATAHKFETLTKSRVFNWHGFLYEWNTTTHRLSNLGTRFGEIKELSTSTNLKANHEFTLKIGNFPPDSADYNIYYSGINANAFFIGWGATKELGISTNINHGGEAKITIRKNVSELHSYSSYKQLNRNNHSTVKVLLNGFHIKSGNNDEGWHFGGLGMSVYNAKWIDDGTIEFTVWIYARPSNSPDPLTRYSGNCVYEFIIDYLVLIGNPYQLKSIDKTLEGSTARDTSINFLWDGKIQGTKGFTYGFAGLYGFEFHLSNPTEGIVLSGETGRYIARLGNYLYGVAYDQSTGLCTFKAIQEFANYGGALPEITYPWSLKSKMHCCLVQAIAGEFKFVQKSLEGKISDSLTDIKSVEVSV